MKWLIWIYIIVLAGYLIKMRCRKKDNQHLPRFSAEWFKQNRQRIINVLFWPIYVGYVIILILRALYLIWRGRKNQQKSSIIKSPKP